MKPRKSTPGKHYPPHWSLISQDVKDQAGWRCVRCDHPHDIGAGYMLTVHHLDLNPQNCAWWNIPALCQKCHLQIQHKVVMEQDWMLDHSRWFRPYVAVYYGIRAGLLQGGKLSVTTDYHDSLILVRKEFVEDWLDYLLQLGKPQLVARS